MPGGESAPSSASTGIGRHCGGLKPMEGVVEERGRDWFVGVDWASQTHHVFVIDAQGRKVGERGFAHGGEGLAEMAAWIGKQTGAAPDAVSVAIEVPHGPVVESLMERGFRVHSINPKQLDRFRDRFSPAGAKDDSRDAQCWPTHCGRTRVAFAAWSRWIRSSSNCGNGPASAMI